MTTKTYINGVEYDIDMQHDKLYEDILHAKVKRMSRQIRHDAKMSLFMKRIISFMAIAIIGLSAGLIYQMHQLSTLNTNAKASANLYNELQRQYTIICDDYAKIQNDYTELASNLNYTDTVDEEVYEVTSVNSGFVYNSEIPLSSELQEYAYNKCEENGLDYNVFLALIRNESSFNPNAISKSNDYGLCQINICNHKWMRSVFGSDWDPLNPYHSIDASTYILSNLINSYSKINNYHTLLMSYNMGYDGAVKCFNQGIYSSKYSRTIMSYATEYGYSGDGVI